MKYLKFVPATNVVISGLLLCMLLPAMENTFANFAKPPLRLISFNARNVENVILLEWRTVGENNTDHFTVEQGSDGVTFKKVGSMKAAGVDPLNRYYTYTDIKPNSGNNYYRLAMYDLDGTVKYSATQLIKADNIKRLTVVPNPVANSTSLTVQWNSFAAGAASISIFELSGRQMYKGKLDASGKTAVDIRNWQPGVYCITLDNGVRFEFSKLIVQN